MRLASLRDPFDHPDWLFELKYDGFRALGYVGATTRLVSRNLHVYKPFGDLCEAITVELQGRSAVLDGEIVCLDRDGRPQFYDLLRRRQPACFYAFDQLSLDGQSLRSEPLIERKQRLKGLIGTDGTRLLYVDHVDGHGVRLYDAAASMIWRVWLRSGSTASTTSATSNHPTGASRCTRATRTLPRA